MKIDTITDYDSLLREKQIQPAMGQRCGKITLIVGSPGAGKNWTINNMTDIRSRYKIFDSDTVSELSSKYNPSKISAMFRKYIADNTEGEELLNIFDQEGMKYFMTTISKPAKNLLYSFTKDTGIFDKKMMTFIKSISNGSDLPNIAFNVTLRNIAHSDELFSHLSSLGYDVNDVDIVWVVAPDTEILSRIKKRSGTLRGVDFDYRASTVDKITRNMFDILKGDSPLSKNVKKVYVVYNMESTIKYYDDTNVIKDFHYDVVKVGSTKDIDKLNKKFKMLGVYKESP